MRPSRTPRPRIRRASPPRRPGLPVIDGLRTADGLRRVAGNAKLYRNLLKQFVEGHTDAAAKIRESLDSRDRAVAERLAYTVKGVAGTIGAGPVQVAAAGLEKAIRDRADNPIVEALRGKLGTVLIGFAASLRPFLEERLQDPALSVESPPIDPAVLKAVVERLAGLLGEADAAAMDLLETEGPVLRSLFAPDAFRAFERLVTFYSFDEALVELRRAAAEKRA